MHLAVRELSKRIAATLTFDELIVAVKTLAQYGGVVSADKGWEMAMAALSSTSLTGEQRAALLALLGDGEPPEQERLPDALPGGLE